MQAFQDILLLTAPLFLLVLGGFALARWAHWPREVGDGMTRFTFSVAIPVLLFRLMSGFSRLPAVDTRLLAAFFGGCLIVFLIGRLVGRWVFAMDGVSQSVFAVGGIFSNNVLVGVPMAKVTLGEEAMPAVSLVLLFNALILWTLVTVSVEWARKQAPSWRGLLQMARTVLGNPIVASILAGTVFGFLGLPLPRVLDQTLALVGQTAVPLSLIVLGLGLAEHRIRAGWRESVVISLFKLAAQPLIVFLLARALGLPPRETQAVVLLAALPVGVNVYLMARQFGALEGPVAASLVLSTLGAAVTTPLVLALVGVTP
jgi:malonate transporter